MSQNVFVPKVVLLGRPNVGKSTLFNRLIRSNRAITHDRPGVTRDRMEGVVRTRGQEDFAIVDTGGVTLDSHAHVEEGPDALRGFEEEILKQAQDAIAEANLLCLVVDARDGLTPFDQHLAEYIRKANKPLLLVLNKVDGPEHADLLMADFHILGLEIIPCSAAHGFNIRELEMEMRLRLFTIEEEEEDLQFLDDLNLDGATKRQRKKLVEQAVANNRAEKNDTLDSEEVLPEQTEEVLPNFEVFDDGTVLVEDANGEMIRVYYENPEKAPLSEQEEQKAKEAAKKKAEIEAFVNGDLRVAMLGRPNAGKSSLVNALAGQSRMIVSDVAGTTRDSVDVKMEIEGETCVFVDTAGVRRRAKITDTVERYSVNSSLKSTTKAHVTLLVLDASEGLTQQDKRLIDLLSERKTPFMVLVNKADLMQADKRKQAEKMYKEALVFCPHVPLLFVSAKSKHNLKKIVPLARDIRQECTVRVPTSKLNRAMTQVLDTHQPPIVKGVRAKFFYLTQAESLPPTFVFFVSNADRVLASYARYLEKSLRKIFEIHHAPMRVHFRSSHKKKGK